MLRYSPLVVGSVIAPASHPSFNLHRLCAFVQSRIWLKRQCKIKPDFRKVSSWFEGSVNVLNFHIFNNSKYSTSLVIFPSFTFRRFSPSCTFCDTRSSVHWVRWCWWICGVCDWLLSFRMNVVAASNRDALYTCAREVVYTEISTHLITS